MIKLNCLLRSASVIFWDFDGIIKDSVTVKSVGFEQLFLPYGKDVAKRVVRHHESHGGVSRYEKMPIYLGWAGELATTDQIQNFCDRFSNLVLQAVIDAPWVPGVREYLEAYHSCQHFVLVTATPQKEIQQILCALEMSSYFLETHGAPMPKAMVIRDVLQRLEFSPKQALMVGDSETDLSAAVQNNVPFLLRSTTLNQTLQKKYSGPIFENLNHA